MDDSDSLFDAPPMGEQERMVEAILFATAEPVGVAELNSRMPHGCDAAEALQLLRRRDRHGDQEQADSHLRRQLGGHGVDAIEHHLAQRAGEIRLHPERDRILAGDGRAERAVRTARVD